MIKTLFEPFFDLVIRFYSDKLNKLWFVRQQKLEGHTLSNFTFILNFSGEII